MFWKKQNRTFFVCLATADSISISVLQTEGSRFVVKKNKLKPRKQKLKQHKTARGYNIIIL